MPHDVIPLRVLVADDDRALRAVVVASLRRTGYDVVQAANVQVSHGYCPECYRHVEPQLSALETDRLERR